jgi:two-component system alkaline phosphatase synthesis response regulator PhoP
MERKAKILLIDDDPDFVSSTKRILESGPYEVMVAYGGQEGLARTREEEPDLILLDVIMPLRDGFTVCEEIKGNPDFEHIPVLMLTSFAQRVGETNIAVSRGMMLEAEDYLEKPINPDTLLERVARQLSKRKSREADEEAG